MKIQYGYVYSCVVCPDCSADLTEYGAIRVDLRTNNGQVLGPYRICLSPEDSVGVLSDPDGFIAAGKHGETFCGRCNRSLTDQEHRFEWTQVDGGVALAAAITAARQAAGSGLLTLYRVTTSDETVHEKWVRANGHRDAIRMLASHFNHNLFKKPCVVTLTAYPNTGCGVLQPPGESVDYKVTRTKTDYLIECQFA